MTIAHYIAMVASFVLICAGGAIGQQWRPATRRCDLLTAGILTAHWL
jgi:hypothetical protein